MEKSKTFELWFPWTPGTVGIREDELGAIHNRPLAQTIGRVCNDLGWHARQVYFSVADVSSSSVHDGVENTLFPLSFRSLRRSGRFGHQVSIKALAHLAASSVGCIAFFQAHGEFPCWGARICEARRIPYLVIVGGWYEGYNRSLARYYGRAHRVLTHTTMQLEALCRAGHSRHNMQVFPIGVDTELFSRKEVESYDLRHEWPRFLYVGRMDEHKGVVQAAQAFSVVIQKHPRSTLTIIGPRGDAKTTEALVRLVGDRHLESAVRILGPMNNGELPAYYRRADLLLFPSRYEGLPQVVLESMACGTPAIVIRGSGGTEEAVEDGECGWVSEMPNVTYDLLRILEDRAEIRRRGENAARRIHAHYTARRSYMVLADILDHCAP